MTFRVICRHRKCDGYKVVSEEPNHDAASEVRRRHHALVGHRADIETILHTPHEGLLL